MTTFTRELINILLVSQCVYKYTFSYDDLFGLLFSMALQVE